jgi:SAM-dependent methyltransferase
MKMSAHYCCTEANCNHAPLLEHDDGLHCSNGHVFPYIQGTRVPLFACEAEDANDYALEDAATIHDNALRWVFDTFGTDEPSLRKSLISRLHLSKGETILVTGAGAGNDLPFLAESLEGSGVIYAQDISKQMLMAGVDRYGSQQNALGVEIYFSASDATNLPFGENAFDAAYHFGGLNLFPNIRKGISEMNRVVKPGGRIVISDEGVAPWLKPTELGKMLIKNNPLYVYDAPLSLLPDTARSVSLSWELSNCFYVIEFTVADTLPDINIDVPHIGKRGGSIRSRYLGQLEGVDPSLRDRVYAEAEKQGISRVAYLERLLRNGCV